MQQHPDRKQGQHGSAMVLALFILSILTVVGLLAARTTTTEVQMATNEMRHRQTFYTAEGVAELVSEILEQNIACPNGFVENSERGGLVQVETPDFWKNKPDPGQMTAEDNHNNPPARDMRIPIGTNDSEPHTNVFIGGAPELSIGNALQTAAGYGGTGRSAAKHGAHIVYDQIIQHRGHFNAEAIVKIQWRHVIGTEGTCSP